MRLDSAKIIAAARLWDNPWVQRETLAAMRDVVTRTCEAFNNALDEALFSVDPTALERLGVMIAEHALRVRELPHPSEVEGPNPPHRVDVLIKRVNDLEGRLARAEALVEALVGPRVIIGPDDTVRFRSLDDVERADLTQHDGAASPIRRRPRPQDLEVTEVSPALSLIDEPKDPR